MGKRSSINNIYSVPKKDLKIDRKLNLEGLKMLHRDS